MTYTKNLGLHFHSWTATTKPTDVGLAVIAHFVAARSFRSFAALTAPLQVLQGQAAIAAALSLRLALENFESNKQSIVGGIIPPKPFYDAQQ